MDLAAWRPADALEEELRRTRSAGDRERYLRALAGADLLLPLLGEPDTPTWATTTADNRTMVLAFTSRQALAAALGRPERSRRARFGELARTWPDPQLWLAVDPGLPIEAYLDPVAVQELAAVADETADEREQTLRDAADRADLEAFVEALSTAPLCVPIDGRPGHGPAPADPALLWWRLELDGRPIAVYTSDRRLRDQLGEQEWVQTTLAELALAWPDGETAMAVNPGSVFGSLLDGPVIAVVAELVKERLTAVRGPDGGRPDGAPAASANGAVPLQLAGPVDPASGGDGVEVQVVVLPAQVARYLDSGHNRVAGLIHRRPDVALPLADLYAYVGLLGDGSPFRADDEFGYMLRWTEPAADAYETPVADGIEMPAAAVLVRVHRSGREEPVARYSPPAGWTGLSR
ncbi:SseB family protein [Dactylosporangium sp. CA-092794]|uniref:SseB family protein n=1 Tax=Dactylosporangium sp. CA-092794 TaxID=3239929 RepID=UPI003D8AA7CB